MEARGELIKSRYRINNHYLALSLHNEHPSTRLSRSVAGGFPHRSLKYWPDLRPYAWASRESRRIRPAYCITSVSMLLAALSLVLLAVDDLTLAAPFSFSMTSPGCARAILGPHLGHEGEDTGHAQEKTTRARTHTHTPRTSGCGRQPPRRAPAATWRCTFLRKFNHFSLNHIMSYCTVYMVKCKM